MSETEDFGRRFAREMKAGDVVALAGELGAGKTHFTKGIVAALGSENPVTSPTFTLVHEYLGGRLPIYHFDFFRLENRQALDRLALDDYLFGDGISVIEWADRFPEVIPEHARWVTLEIKSEDTRTIHIR
ncbi:MAG: tRNA threonylcarbamoyladenosine biosynthesis protein TsaE [Verrucomicrobiota bacterium]